MARLIDLSHKIIDHMPAYPGDSRASILQVKHLATDGYNDHRLDTGMHSGTHVDSPMHLTDSRKYISEMPLDSFIGAGCILDVRGQTLIKDKPEYIELVKENSIVLLFTGHDRFYGTDEYYSQHPCIDLDFCEMLIRKKVKMVGMDTPSPDQFPFEYHKILFKNNIFILENLTNLAGLIGIERFEVIALPLSIRADSSMTRAIARVL